MKFTRTALQDDLPGATVVPASQNYADSPVGDLREQVIEIIKTIYDPEIPVNIYELGLIYDVSLDSSNFVDIKMTLTSPACPVAGSLPGEVEMKAGMVPGVSGARVELVWEPAWEMSKMSEAAKLQLNLM